MIIISNIYVINTGSLLHMINISWCSKNSQHYMLPHPNVDKISINNYKQEILPTFMLENCVYVTRSLNWVYVELISNIQCYIYKKKTQFHKKYQGTLPTVMFVYLVNIYSFDAWGIYVLYSRHYISVFTIFY